MKRDEFLKKLAVGVGVAVVTPTVLMAKEPVRVGGKVNLAIDLMSIQDITSGGRKLTPADIMELWYETGVLIYRSHTPAGIPCNAPVVFKGKIEVVDVDVFKLKG